MFEIQIKGFADFSTLVEYFSRKIAQACDKIYLILIFYTDYRNAFIFRVSEIRTSPIFQTLHHWRVIRSVCLIVLKALQCWNGLEAQKL